MARSVNPLLKPILLVEDNPNDIELTMIALEQSDLANPIISIRDGAEALDYLHRTGKWEGRNAEHPAVVLLDKKLPKVDGHEVLRAIRNDPVLRFTPIVMLTSSKQETDLLKSYELGVNAYVVKPVEFNDFMRAIGDLGVFWGVVNEPHPRLGG